MKGSLIFRGIKSGCNLKECGGEIIVQESEDSERDDRSDSCSAANNVLGEDGITETHSARARKCNE
jgi:hypothetical protein